MNPECNHFFVFMDNKKKCIHCGVVLNCNCKYLNREFIRDICNGCVDMILKYDFYIGD
jgi:hypothetical protein